MFWIYVLSLPCLLAVGVLSNLQLSDSGCYGSPPNNTVHAQCNPNEIIVIESIYGYAKALTTDCPNYQTDGKPAPSQCCEITDQECPVRYRGFSQIEYYEECQGQSSCSETNVAWTTSTCGATYLQYTNFMVLYYQCVKASAVPGHCDDVTSSGSEEYLWNTGYPSGISASSSCTCAVTVSCDTKIEIHALDVALEGSPCSQNIMIEDNRVITNLTCSHNNNKITELIYTSNGPYIKLTVKNLLPVDSGRFFFQFKGKNSNGDISVACGNQISSLSTSDKPSCPTTSLVIDDVSIKTKNLSFSSVNYAVIKSNQNITLTLADHVTWSNDTHQEIKVSGEVNITSDGDLLVDNEHGTQVTVVGGGLLVKTNVTIYSSTETETTIDGTETQLVTSSDVHVTSSVYESNTPRIVTERDVDIDTSGNQLLKTDGEIVTRAGNWTFINGSLFLVDGDLEISDEHISLRLRGTVNLQSGTIQTNNDTIRVNLGTNSVEASGQISVANGTLILSHGSQHLTAWGLDIDSNGSLSVSADGSVQTNGSALANYGSRQFQFSGSSDVNSTHFVIQDSITTVTSHPFNIITNGTVLQTLKNPDEVFITAGETKVTTDQISLVTGEDLTMANGVITVEGQAVTLNFQDSQITTNRTVVMTANSTSLGSGFKQIDNNYFSLQTDGILDMAGDTLSIQNSSNWLQAFSNFTIMRGNDVITVAKGTTVRFTGSVIWRNGSLVIPETTSVHFYSGVSSLHTSPSIATTGNMIVGEQVEVNGGQTSITDNNIKISTSSNVTASDTEILIHGGPGSSLQVAGFAIDTNGTISLNRDNTQNLEIVKGTHVISTPDYVITTDGNITIHNGSLIFDHTSFSVETKEDMVLIKDGIEHRIKEGMRVDLTGDVQIVDGTIIVTGGTISFTELPKKSENEEDTPIDGSSNITTIAAAVALLAVIAISAIIACLCRNKIKEKCKCFRKVEDNIDIREEKLKELLFIKDFTGPLQTAPHGTKGFTSHPNKVFPSPLPPEPIAPPPSHLPPIYEKTRKPRKPKHKSKQDADTVLKSKGIKKKEEALSKKQIELEQKEASLRKLERKLSASLDGGLYTNGLQGSHNGTLPSLRKAGNVALAVSALNSLKSQSYCVDITDNDTGELISSHTSHI